MVYRIDNLDQQTGILREAQKKDLSRMAANKEIATTGLVFVWLIPNWMP